MLTVMMLSSPFPAVPYANRTHIPLSAATLGIRQHNSILAFLYRRPDAPKIQHTDDGFERRADYPTGWKDVRISNMRRGDGVDRRNTTDPHQNQSREK